MTLGFLPHADNVLYGWLDRFQCEIAIQAGPLNVPPAKVAELQALCTEIMTQIMAVEAARSALAGVVALKEATKGKNLGTLRKEIARLKTAVDMTPAIAAKLQIVGAKAAVDWNAFKPEFKAEAHPGFVRIKWVKGPMDSIQLYTRRRGQAEWTFLARDTQSPYEDRRPLTTPFVPEAREYLARAVSKDVEVGLSSVILCVVFGG